MHTRSRERAHFMPRTQHSINHCPSENNDNGESRVGRDTGELLTAVDQEFAARRVAFVTERDLGASFERQERVARGRDEVAGARGALREPLRPAVLSRGGDRCDGLWGDSVSPVTAGTRRRSNTALATPPFFPTRMIGGSRARILCSTRTGRLLFLTASGKSRADGFGPQYRRLHPFLKRAASSEPLVAFPAL
jgi:hypothetical protein